MTALPSLGYDETEQDLRMVVADLLDDRCQWLDVLARADGAGKDPTLWRSIVAMGLPGLPVDATWRETAVVMEELGRRVADVPYLTSSVLALALAQGLGADDVVTALASGEAVGCVLVPFGGDRPVRLDAHAGTWSGRVPLVAGALDASLFLLPTPAGVVLLDAVDSRAVPSLDMTRPLADVELVHARGRLLADPADCARAFDGARDLTLALLASEQLGLAEWCLATTIEYVGTRRQFGRPIGSFQAVKHRLADLWTEVMKARAVARYAAGVAASGPREELTIAAALAQVVCGRTALAAAETCVQLHGGIGFTWEHPVHLYLKRARADALALGGTAAHRRRLGRALDLAPRPEERA